MPVYHWLRSAVDVLARREMHPRLEPVHELQQLQDAEVWESTGRDPPFNLSGKVPTGWAEITLDIAPQNSVTGRARLYVDRGAGYNETDSFDLGEVGREHKSFVRLSPDIVTLRLDPFESVGQFRIRTLTVKAVRAPRARQANGYGTPQGGGLGGQRFVQFALARLSSYRQKHGHAPRLHELPAAVRRTLRAWNHQQPTPELAPLQAAHLLPNQTTARSRVLAPPVEPYEAWLEVNEWNERRESLLKERLSAIAEPPLLSIVMPVYNPPPEFLDQAIASVARQVYGRWELCIADDA